MIVNNQLLIV